MDYRTRKVKVRTLMKSYIKFNGTKSSDLGIEIHNNLSFSNPQKRYREIEVYGRDGVLYADNYSTENVKKDIFITVNSKDTPKNGSDGKPIFDRALEISKWINVKGFKEFEYSMYPDFIFRAMVIDPYNITDTTRKTGRGLIRFIFEPIMYYKGYEEEAVTSGKTLNNIGSIDAKPLIKVVPKSKDIDVYNNDKIWFRLRNLEINKELYIDSKIGQVYGNDGKLNDKMLVHNPLFPLLYPGKNKITFSNAEISITPRYGEYTI